MTDTAVLDHYLDPLRPFLEPADVTELVINRPGEVGVEADGAWRWSETPELTEAWLRTLAVAAAAYTGQDVGPEHPICSTTLPGDIRCQIVLPPVAADGGLSLTLRKPSRRRMAALGRGGGDVSAGGARRRILRRADARRRRNAGREPQY